MSEMGQTRHFDRAPTTSGLPLTTDLGEMRERVRLVPFSDFDVETLSHVTARRHTDAVDVVLTGACTRLTAARITAWYRRGGCRRAP